MVSHVGSYVPSSSHQCSEPHCQYSRCSVDPKIQLAAYSTHFVAPSVQCALPAMRQSRPPAARSTAQQSVLASTFVSATLHSQLVDEAMEKHVSTAESRHWETAARAITIRRLVDSHSHPRSWSRPTKSSSKDQAQRPIDSSCSCHDL